MCGVDNITAKSVRVSDGVFGDIEAEIVEFMKSTEVRKLRAKQVTCEGALFVSEAEIEGDLRCARGLMAHGHVSVGGTLEVGGPCVVAGELRYGKLVKPKGSLLLSEVFCATDQITVQASVPAEHPH